VDFTTPALSFDVPGSEPQSANGTSVWRHHHHAFHRDKVSRHALVISTYTDFLAFCRSDSPLIFFGWRQKANQIALPRH
jgi:hypothetical protein